MVFKIISYFNQINVYFITRLKKKQTIKQTLTAVV